MLGIYASMFQAFMSWCTRAFVCHCISELYIRVLLNYTLIYQTFCINDPCYNVWLYYFGECVSIF
jgi:hypothetical protein